MTTRVAELEQESTEAQLLLHQARVANYENGYGMTSVSSGGHSIRSGLIEGTVERAEETALRAKNEVLERQLAIMREQLEETKLELNATRKVRMYYYVLRRLKVWCLSIYHLVSLLSHESRFSREVRLFFLVVDHRNLFLHTKI